jgi:conjugal transfer/entry exclusion protein
VVQVLGRFRVGQVVRVAPDLGHDLLAQLALQAGWQFLAAGLSQRRQVKRLRVRRQCHRSAEREGHQQDEGEADDVHG